MPQAWDASQGAMLNSQAANAQFAAASVRNAIIHPYVFQSLPPQKSVTMPRAAKTKPKE